MPGVKPVCASNCLGMIESNAAATHDPGLAVARENQPPYTFRAPGELHRDRIIVADFVVEKQVQPRAETYIIIVVPGVVDADRLEFRATAVPHEKLCAVPHPDLIAGRQPLGGAPLVHILGCPADAIQKREECRKNWFLHNLQVASARKGNRIRPPSKHYCRKMQGTRPCALKIAATLALCELFVIFVGKISLSHV